MTINGDRLRILRRFHNLTQRELAEWVGSPASDISSFERGYREPKGLALEAICSALGVEAGFLSHGLLDDEFQEHETNFRSLVDTPDRLRKKVLAHATLFGTLLDLLTRTVRLPLLNVPQIQATTHDELEGAAERCRLAWGVGADAPILNVTLMLERAGIVVTTLDREISKKVDAFSRYGASNLIVLNPAKGSATRTRFDLAHEAAHGVLHRNGLPLELSAREDQANYLAGALLLPRKSFARDFWMLGKTRTWEQLLELKRRWGASVPAIVVRSYQLGLMDAAEYRRRFKHMGRIGWLRGAEPGETQPETPQLFMLVLRRYQTEHDKSTLAIAQELNWTPELFKQVTAIDPTLDTFARRQSAGSPPASLDEYRTRKLAAK
ncbi:MAG: ImmA/IrrE family metallo-endopeptidase [Gemmatimonadaceae bacterium]|nr:ImmA/IrrE family metallo-endopeptidase [Gemmatimonadaceae bacterium]